MVVAQSGNQKILEIPMYNLKGIVQIAKLKFHTKCLDKR